jgi:hypothetical protein
MYFYNYVLLVGFACLYFNKNTRFASGVFLLGWAFYLLSTIGIEYKFYFLASATIETAIAVLLNQRYRLISYLGYSLLLLNIIGLILHVNGVRFYYDFAYALISVTQFMLLLARAFPDGVNRLHTKSFVVRAVNFDSRGAHNRMYKDLKTQGTN